MSFAEQRKTALAILASDTPASRKAGSFLGQCAVDDSPLSEKQMNWFLTLADRAGIELEVAHVG